ncbi:MAG: ABC-type amino acid transport/signal transduction system periplasmic component/domain-like protein [Burkholderiaceae bacterium]|nr:ABC-type amino acid transport/signal transduction system periplasmic component/domain-like protein [Burkholderiaceae bacterium]
MKRTMSKWTCLCITLASLLLAAGCSKKEDITSLQQLQSKTFAVPTGTVADKLVQSRFPQAKFQYFNSVLDAALAVKQGKADAAAYDEPILKNIAAKNGGMTLLPEKITTDNYAFAVAKENRELKATIDAVISEMKQDGSYNAMQRRWFPDKGAPAAMPELPAGSGGVIRLGTAAVTEPFSFVDGSQKVVGFDIELAQRVAQKRGMKLEIVNMEFGAMIPALIAGKVDMIAACITVTEERAQKVLFSESYYTGGISALVREAARK